MARSAKRRRAVQAGYRSGFELSLAEALEAEGCDFEYEAYSYPLQLPAGRTYKCPDCGVAACRETWYTPDFFLSNGIVIEAKGRFTPDDRRKVLAMREQHPDTDLRLVFEFDNKLSRKAKQRYSEWCKKNGVPYAILRIPRSWAQGLDE
jgi:hypothetical protein